ncbi:hypothetical protein NAP1_11438 [Erythrobacter sp. NAP1]|uniref:hypothetical protein n=1 Tax=Erythrobacter sp. NAP1 TaxID=237727 RepID=UPI00006879DA|nr:hypothetical protein [Erythrobacter sp. NAP1]EAQ28205.1 hypothetical protein NAP1_11438 [Erythrobacter sp. NAP1]
MPETPSILSMLAACLYAVVITASLLAFIEARKARQRPLHGQIWIAIAVIFTLLIASRLLLIEDAVRADLREALRASQIFAARREMQGPFVAGALLLCLAVGFGGAYFTMRKIIGRRDRAVAIAAASCAVMLVIVAMRIISLHAMDSLLYGPLKLNWVGDLGASAAIIGAASFYVLLLRGRIAPKAR